jgi:hypothetical protein
VLLASLMKNLSTNYTKKNLFEFHEKTQLNQAIGLMRLAVGCWRLQRFDNGIVLQHWALPNAEVCRPFRPEESFAFAL